MNYYIYVDDIRDDDTWYRQNLTGHDWLPYICRDYQQTIDMLGVADINNIIIDLDHDLGEGNEMDDTLAPSGYDICKYIVENHIPLVGFHLHTMNPVGRENMRQLLTHYGYKEI